MTVEVIGLHKTFEDVRALDDVTLAAGSGEFLVVVGPSGSGKSTLLRCIAGLEDPDGGTIRVGVDDVTRKPPGARDVAMVFQDYALYPHLDARSNIAFPLLARKIPQAEIDARVESAVSMLDLTEVLARKPAQLSGGERRRVALARAVVRDPAAFLMDEPLASLDVALRRRVQLEIRDLQVHTGTTTVYVTHDQVEAMMLGHRLAVMRDGRIEQSGTPQEVYETPQNAFVASFLGRTPMNLLPVGLIGGGGATVGVRPEHLRPVASGGRLTGTITAVEVLGSEKLLEVDCNGHRVLVEILELDGLGPGHEVHLGFEDRHAHRFSDDGSRLQ